MELHQQAETLLQQQAAPEDEAVLLPEAVQQTLHDLRVHQVELEMQNEELRRVHLELEATQMRYFDLYDLAPVGYCTLSKSGLILEANLTAVDLLGMTRAALINQRITRFIFKEDQDIYYWFSKQLLATDQPQTTELRMVNKEGVTFWAHLQATAAPDEGDEPVCRVMISDITARKQAGQTIRDSEQQMRLVLRGSNLGMWDWNAVTNQLAVNERWFLILGLDLHGPTPTLDFWHGLVHPDDRPKLERIIQEVILNPLGRDFEAEIRVRHSDGRWIWILDAGGVVERAPDGSPLRVSGTHMDITGRKQAEEQLRLAASVFSHAREGILITAADGTILDVNDAFTRITGYSRDEALGRNPRILSSGLHHPEIFAALWRDLVEKGHWYGEIWNRRKCGEVYAEMLTISAVRDDQGRIAHYVGLFSDITFLKEHEQQLEHIAHYDALTSLPNRVLLADRLQQAMAQAQRRGQHMVVALLDLDGFKVINDGHGHETGDHLLMTVAARMKQVLREGDTLARLGGDEFVAVLIDLADIEACVPMLTRLLAAAAQPVSVADVVLQVSASLGVTFYPQADEVDADQLLRQADQAMYQAKQAGKNRYHVFDAEQDRSLRMTHETLERIHRALADHEFVLYYQPKVNMRTGAVIGVEALIRWQHPEQGLLPPAAFLPAIEDHPLAVEIGEWVIETALTQMETWQAVGLNLPVSVNIGARQFQQPNFVQRLRDRLAAHPAIPPDSLELEVLETSALEDLSHISQVIAACRQLGVRFALDDFGTGYSSLTYLKRLAVAVLKIDQSFVRDMLDDPEDLAILEGVISLATAFRREVIAEGVETVAHGELLLQLGCELAQGYGIARPMPAAKFPAWLAGWRPDPRWVNRPAVRHDDLPILFAGVEHRAWTVACEACLNGSRETPPPDQHSCRFGTWLATENLAGRGIQPALLVIAALHQQIHALAAELLDLHNRDRRSETQAGLDELHILRDRLLEGLAGLLQDRQA